MQLKVKRVTSSGSFLKEVKNISRSISGRRLSATLWVPDSLRWWYWLEHGTALRGGNGDTYPIDPIHAGALRFPMNGTEVFRMHVDHPGIRPRAFVSKVLGNIYDKAASDFAQAMVSGRYRYSAAKSALFDSTMPYAEEQIVQSLADEAPGVRSDGRLEGGFAAGTFRENAQIVDRSE